MHYKVKGWWGGLNCNTKHVDPHNLCFIYLLLPFCVSLLTQSKLVTEVLTYGKQRNYMTTVLEKALNAPLISSKDLALPVKTNCIGCSLMYPLLPACCSIPLHPCGLFDDLQPIGSHNPVICWSGWPQNLSMANHVCPWATVGLRKTHTKTHTRQEKSTVERDVCTYAHIAYRALADGRIMSFPQADGLCQQPVLRRRVFSRAKSITGFISSELRTGFWRSVI